MFIKIKPTLVVDDNGDDLYVRYTPVLVWGDVEIPGPFHEEYVSAGVEDHEAARQNARKALLDKLRAVVDQLSKG